MIPEMSGWRAATERALYGPHGFFTREAPAAHFRTSVHASPLFARAVTRLLLRTDEALGHPESLDLVDVGAGRGELLAGVLAELAGPATGPAGNEAAGRLRAQAVERGPRPDGLDSRVEWLPALPPRSTLTGLLFANEWLDNVPVDIAETDTDGAVRLLLVDTEGAERPGPPVAGEEAEWLTRWWPLEGAGPGSRAEIGHPRDTAWAQAVNTLAAGVAVAADYGHTRGARPPFGSLTGYRDGREVPPVPDGTRDLTSHVALDACADRAPGTSGLVTQRAALHGLGLTGRRPPLSLASSDPAAYVRELSAAGEAAELLDPGGLGGFTWLVSEVNCASGLR